MSATPVSQKALDRYKNYEIGSDIMQKAVKPQNCERAKLGISIILGLGALATLLLLPCIQNHTFQDFGQHLLKGLEEAKWAILAGGVTAIVVGTLFGIYVWRKNKEDVIEHRYFENDTLETIANEDDKQVIAAKNSEITAKNAKNLSVNQWVLTFVAAAILSAGAAAFAAWHQHLWNFNDLSKTPLNDLMIAGATAVFIMGVAYSVFKNKELNEIKEAKAKVNQLDRTQYLDAYVRMQELAFIRN